MELDGAGLPNGPTHNIYLTVFNEKDSLEVLRSKTDPGYVTTDFGMDALWYRAGTFVTGMGLLLAWFLGALLGKGEDA